jgi:hypothetical protein
LSLPATHVDLQGEKAMLKDLILASTGLPWAERLIIYDTDNLISRTTVTDELCLEGYSVFRVNNSEELRFLYERDCRQTGTRVVFIIQDPVIRVPYDISKAFATVTLGLETLFPRLDTAILRINRNVDLDFLSIAARFLSGSRLTARQTQAFLTVEMFNQAIVDVYSTEATRELIMCLPACKNYRDWMPVINLLSKLMLLHDKGFEVKGLHETYRSVDSAFHDWSSQQYSSLALSADMSQPVMLHHIPDFLRRNSKKAAIIVIDGMNFVDWQLVRESFADAPWKLEVSAAFSFIPTITSVARESLFSGIIPAQNETPFSLVDEETNWRQYWIKHGIRDEEIFFAKTETPEVPERVKIAGIVVNFIDDLMHRQLQGTRGMAIDIASWLKGGALRRMIENLLAAGFSVYVTSDHGHVEASGMGRFTKPGFLTEDISRRAVIYKDFAGTEGIDKFNVFEYPGTYMSKDYRYFLFPAGECIGDRGNTYVTHGSDAIEELLIPFVRIGEI